MLSMYCPKCKQKHEMKDKDITFKMSKNGRKMASAMCPMDGTTMTSFVKK